MKNAPLKKAILFCSKGIGDGLLFFTLAENLKRHGFTVTVYHDLLHALKNWFFSFSVHPYPKPEEIDKIFQEADLICVNGDERPISIEIVKKAQTIYAYKSHCFFPSTRRQCASKLPSVNFCFDREVHIVENLMIFCQKKLAMEFPTFSNGIVPPNTLVHRKNLKRVIIHPTSSDFSRMWPKKKFLRLAKKLILHGYQPVFCVSEREKPDWEQVDLQGAELFCKPLEESARFFCESGFFIGNDSGMGHLASALKIPTLTICVCQRKKRFWRPRWALGLQIIPWLPLPNIKGLRWREKYWKPFISTHQVWKKFLELVSKAQ